MKKKIVKSIGAISAGILPAAVILSCGADEISPDQQAVNINIDNIKKLDRKANIQGSAILPSTIMDINLLYNYLVANKPVATAGVAIAATIEATNDDKGTLEVKYTVTKGTKTESVAITYTGFRTINQEVIDDNVQLVNNLPKIANTLGTKTLPGSGEITIDSLYDYLEATKPQPTDGATITAQIEGRSDAKGTLNVMYLVKKGGAEEPVDIVFTGFLTTETKNVFDGTVQIINNLSKDANETGKNTLPSNSDITIDSLYDYLVAAKPEAIEGATITPTIKSSSDGDGTLTVQYNVSAGVLTEDIEIVFTGFLTTNQQIINENVDLIDNLSKEANIEGAKTLPSQITNADSLYNYLVATKPSPLRNATITPKIEPFEPGGSNDVNGTLKVTYTVQIDTLERTVPITFTGFDFNWVANSKRILADASLTPGWVQQIDPTHYLMAKNDGIYEVGINPTSGDVYLFANEGDKFTGSGGDFSRGWSTQLRTNLYLISAGPYFYFVDVNETDGTIGTVKQVDPVTPRNLYGGVLQKVDETHYLATAQQDVALYQIELTIGDNAATSSLTVETLPLPGAGTPSLPAAYNGWIQQMDVDNYLIGTNAAGVYQVQLDSVKKEVISTEAVLSQFGLPENTGDGFSLKIDDSHYLISGGTQETPATKGMYQVTVNSTGAVTKADFIPLTIIPDVINGFGIQIDPTHYLIGTGSAGLYQVEIDINAVDNNWIKKARPVPSSPISSETNFNNSWIQEITPNQYLVATKTGIYQIDLATL